MSRRLKSLQPLSKHWNIEEDPPKMVAKKKQVALTSSQLVAGMTIQVGAVIYRVDTAQKVAPPRGDPFIKATLKLLGSDKTVEKSFKLDQTIEEVALVEKSLVYLYLEGKNYLFLDTENLIQVELAPTVIGGKANFLKEGIYLKASCFGDTIFSVELPQFLELTVAKTDDLDGMAPVSNSTKIAQLETGAKVDVPLFIEPGDVVKVDTYIGEFIQRV